MKTNFNLRAMTLGLGLVAGVLCSGCGRGDTRVNSDPGPGRPSAADTGEPVVRAEETSKGVSSGAASTSPTTGTDSTGRPGSASGGTTGAGSGSGTSGTQTGAQPGSR